MKIKKLKPLDKKSKCEWCGTKKENSSGLCNNCGRFPSLNSFKC